MTTYSLRDLGLSPGQAKTEELELELVPYHQAGVDYAPAPATVPARLDVSAMTEGTSFHLRLEADYVGPCARCLEPATFHARVDSFEVHERTAQDEELKCHFVDDVANTLDVSAWTQEAVGLLFPTKVLCRRDCLGLCPVCGVDQNETGLHEHETPTDSRWDALRDLQLDAGAEAEQGDA